MKPLSDTIVIIGLIIGLLAANIFSAKLTTGTPLGGMGASYIAYNAANGKFVKGYRLTGEHWYSEKAFNAGFHLFTRSGESVKTVANMQSADEDALIPIYNVKYGAANNNIDVTLVAFGPYVTGDEKSSVMPLALFEFSVENKNADAAEAAIAFQIVDLVLGTNPTRLEAGNGVFFSGDENATLLGSSDLAGAIVSTGTALDAFNASGVLENGNGGIVAVKTTLEPSQIGRIRFVVGWYQNFVDKDWAGKTVDEGFYYQTYYRNSTDIATYGLTEFVRIRDGACDFVNRIRGVNLPDWYTDRLLNSLYPLMHNSQFARDGRVAWREGKYPIIGTIDQQGHAQIATSYNWPEGQWRQMEFWARTQNQGDYTGQIHHDFNGPTGVGIFINAMCGWDEHDHTDYWWSPSKNWSDLNSLFIINTYELFLATGNVEYLNKLWPKLALTGGRLLFQAYRCIDNQLASAPAPWSSEGYYLPHQCLGSYDRESATNEYNGTLALNAYSCLKNMAQVLGKADTAAMWDSIFTIAKSQFSQEYSSKSSYCEQNEGEFGVYSWSRHLGLPVVIDDAEITAAFERYWDKSAFGTNLLPWHFYTINHFGDAGIAIGEVDRGLAVHKKDYDEFCAKKPQYYFWQDLDADFGLHSYMTAPVVWRSYLLISGYCLDKFNQRLWIRPQLPSENNGKLTNAPLINPGNWGTLNYTETGNGTTQSVHVRFDKPVIIKEVRLKNPDGLTTHAITTIDKDKQPIPNTVSYYGTGLDAQIIVTFDQPLTVGLGGFGIGVDVTDIGIDRGLQKNTRTASSLKAFTTDRQHLVRYTIEQSGRVVLNVFSVNGSLVTSIPLGRKTKGSYSTTIGRLPSGFYFIRLDDGSRHTASTSLLVAR